MRGGTAVFLSARFSFAKKRKKNGENPLQKINKVL